MSDPLAGLRHDLRTPLNQILGYSEMLEEDAAAAGQADVVADLQKIQAAARRLLEVISTRLADGLTMPVGRRPHDAGDRHDGGVADEAAADGRMTRRALHGRVLVVDDVEENRDVLTRRLRLEGLDVATAADGRAALDLARAGAYDLILLDILMPELDGYATLRALKADAGLRHVPVIMISALDELSSVVRCVEAGAEDYLPKPFEPTLLRARIGACLEKKQLRDAEQEHVRVIEQTQARLSAELEQAAAYVRSIIPAPITQPVRVDWRYQPSSELGGDAFGYHAIDADHFAIYLLDVCGHGVGPSLLSVAAINVIRSGSLPGADPRDPGAVLEALNLAFPMERQNNMYFTLWYGVYHLPSRTLRHASGGHPPALLLVPGPDGAWQAQRLESTGLMIGAIEGVTWGTVHTAVPPGAHLIVLCDGCYEITRPDGSMLSFADFEAASLAQGGAPDALDRLAAWAEAQAAPGGLDDDFSMLRVSV